MPGKTSVHTELFDRCVAKVKAKGGKGRNAYAICQASLGEQKAIKPGHRRK